LTRFKKEKQNKKEIQFLVKSAAVSVVIFFLEEDFFSSLSNIKKCDGKQKL